VVSGTDRLACREAFFVNNPLEVKEIYEHALDFALRVSRLFRSLSVWAFLVRLVRLSNHCQCLRRSFPEIFTRFDSVPCSLRSNLLETFPKWKSKYASKLVSYA
jgi:hypothetical protein